jgi:hypothetical protein
MNELLAEVIDAHGGLDRWSSLNLGGATIITGGGLWGLKGLVQDATPRRMTVSLHEERASVNPFGDPDWHTQFTPERIAIVRSDGSVVKERMNPRASFAGHNLDPDQREPWQRPEPRGEPCTESRRSPPEGPGKRQGVAFRRSRGPRSRLQRAFRLTNIPSRGTVEPGDGGYPDNLRWIRELPACAPL